jgi:hypothetical protein
MVENEFMEEINDAMFGRAPRYDRRSAVEVRPGAEDYFAWTDDHEYAEHAVICSFPDYQDTPYCRTGPV